MSVSDDPRSDGPGPGVAVRSGQRVPQPGESLLERCPEVAAELHPVLNGSVQASQIRVGSADRFWWLCSVCGHEWRTSASKRTWRGPRNQTPRGCPRCRKKAAGRRLSTPAVGQSLATRYPAVAAEWHPDRNGQVRAQDVFPGSNIPRWWRCECGSEWQQSPNKRARSHQDVAHTGAVEQCLKPVDRLGRGVPSR